MHDFLENSWLSSPLCASESNIPFGERASLLPSCSASLPQFPFPVCVTFQKESRRISAITATGSYALHCMTCWELGAVLTLQPGDYPRIRKLSDAPSSMNNQQMAEPGFVYRAQQPVLLVIKPQGLSDPKFKSSPFSVPAVP